MVKVDHHFIFFDGAAVHCLLRMTMLLGNFLREFNILFFKITKDVQRPVVKLLKRAHFNGSAEKLIN